MTELLLDPETFAPRTEEEKYRLYERGADGELILVATTGTAEGVGVALVTLADDRREAGDPAPIVGVLDGLAGRWISGLWQT